MHRPRSPRNDIQRSGARRARRLRQTIAEEVHRAREDAGLSQRALARAAGIGNATLNALEQGRHDPRTEVLARVAAALGMDLSVRLYQNAGPLVRDHLQAAMITALIRSLHPSWQAQPEVPVYRPIRGVIDLVLSADIPPDVAVEAHSDLRRIEQQIRWARAKADALAEARDRPVSQLLLLRSTRRLRRLADAHGPLLEAAYPFPTSDAFEALTRGAPWRGPAIVWSRVEHGQAVLLRTPPRGVRLGRSVVRRRRMEPTTNAPRPKEIR